MTDDPAGRTTEFCPGCEPGNPAAREGDRCEMHERHEWQAKAIAAGWTPPWQDRPDTRPFGKDTCGVCNGRFSVGDHTDGRCVARAAIAGYTPEELAERGIV